MDKFYRKKFWFMVAPAIILFMLVVVIPFIQGMLYSFTDWRGSYFVGGEHWWESFVGLKNYLSIFKDKDFLSILGYTSLYAFMAVIFQNIVSLALALGIKKIVKGKDIFRVIFFFPYILGMIAMGYVWRFIFENVLVGIPFISNLLQNKWTALLAFTIVGVWQVMGYYMIIYLNGLNSIDSSIYEAAEIDGATSVKSFFSITLPLLMPSITVVLFMSLASSFKMLDLNVSLTEGNFGTTMMSYQILKTVRESSPPEYGIAQAQAVIFFLLVAALSIAQVIFTKNKEVDA